MLMLQFFIVLVCLGIAYQDFKFRAVYWWLFPVLLFACAEVVFLRTDLQLMFANLFYNSVFLAIQLLLLTLYFTVKERRLVNILDGYFGLGDLLFLLAITVYLSFLNYVLFYLLSLFGIIAVGFLTQAMVKKPNPKIPLAGEQALVLVGFILVEQLHSGVNLLSDVWLVNYFIN